MGHDGIHYLPLGSNCGSSESGLVALNHECTIGEQLFPDGAETWSEEKAKKEQAAHGVLVVEAAMNADGERSSSTSLGESRL
jgi:secreted PhoX family phosphatase